MQTAVSDSKTFQQRTDFQRHARRVWEETAHEVAASGDRVQEALGLRAPEVYVDLLGTMVREAAADSKASRRVGKG